MVAALQVTRPQHRPQRQGNVPVRATVEHRTDFLGASKQHDRCPQNRSRERPMGELRRPTGDVPESWEVGDGNVSAAAGWREGRFGVGHRPNVAGRESRNQAPRATPIRLAVVALSSGGCTLRARAGGPSVARLPPERRSFARWSCLHRPNRVREVTIRDGGLIQVLRVGAPLPTRSVARQDRDRLAPCLQLEAGSAIRPRRRGGVSRALATIRGKDSE